MSDRKQKQKKTKVEDDVPKSKTENSVRMFLQF